MKYVYLILEIVILILLIVILSKVSNYSDFQKVDTNEIQIKLDSLKLQKDSIRSVVDSTHIKIINNENHYREVVNSILYQPVDSDYRFLSEYARFHRNQRISNNLCGESETK